MADENKPPLRLVQSLEGDEVFGSIESVTGDDGTGAPANGRDTVDFLLGTSPDIAARMQNITPGPSAQAQSQTQPGTVAPEAPGATTTAPQPEAAATAAPAPFKLLGFDFPTLAKIAIGGALIWLALSPSKKSKLEALAGNIHRVDIEGEEDEWEEEDEVEAAPAPLAGDKPKPKKKRKPRKPKLKMAPPAAPLSEVPAPAVEPEIVKSVPPEAKVVA